MPTLCRKLDIPYCIVKSKSRLGSLVHLKTATCVAVVNVLPEDKKDFGKIIEMCRINFNERGDQIAKQQGGGKLGLKSSARIEARTKAVQQSEQKKKE